MLFSSNANPSYSCIGVKEAPKIASVCPGDVSQLDMALHSSRDLSFSWLRDSLKTNAGEGRVRPVGSLTGYKPGLAMVSTVQSRDREAFGWAESGICMKRGHSTLGGPIAVGRGKASLLWPRCQEGRMSRQGCRVKEQDKPLLLRSQQGWLGLHHLHHLRSSSFDLRQFLLVPRPLIQSF